MFYYMYYLNNFLRFFYITFSIIFGVSFIYSKALWNFVARWLWLLSLLCCVEIIVTKNLIDKLLIGELSKKIYSWCSQVLRQKKKKKKNDHKIVYDAICHLSSTLNHIGRLVWVRMPWLNFLFPYFTNSSLCSKLIQSNIWSIWNTYCYKHLS